MNIQSNILSDKVLVGGKLQKAKLAKFASLAKNPVGDGKKAMPKAEMAQLEKAARGFESMFLHQMLKSMKKAMLSGDKKENLTTFGAETLGGYSDMLLADEMSRAGKGMGIADLVFKQLSGGRELNNITQSPVLEKYSTNNNNINPKKLNSENIKQTFLDRMKGRIDNYDDIINNASELFGVDSDLIKAVIGAESAGKSDAVSSVGAKGLMQLMDPTAKGLGVKNSFNPEENIKGGANYLQKMIEKFGSKELGLAAYNAGPRAVEKYNGIPPYPETQNYVKKVLDYETMFEKLGL
jgi:Rod binding domain-containing protein